MSMLLSFDDNAKELYAEIKDQYPIVLPYFIFSFAYALKPFFGNWFAKCDFSYGLYLYSFLIQQIIYHQLKKFFDPSLNITSLICFVFAFLCAVVSWYLIEKPTQALAKKLLAKMKPQRKESARTPTT